MVDVERGRTVEGWLPRRLGGGRGPGRQGLELGFYRGKMGISWDFTGKNDDFMGFQL